MTPQTGTELRLDEIEARANAATPGPWTVSEDYSDVVGPEGDQLASYWNPTSETRNGEFIAHARTDVPALVAEVRRLRDRVAEVEGPAVEARAALAALCYDLEDPGAAALGALYLISQATIGVEAPRDDAAEALARHDADVIRKAAQVLEETDRDDDAVNLLYTLADIWGRDEEAHVVADDSDDPEHVDDCPGCPAALVGGEDTRNNR